MLLKTSRSRAFIGATLLLLFHTTASADEVRDALKFRACITTLQSFLNHYDGVVDTWLAKPEAPLSVQRAFKELTREHQKGLDTAKDLTALSIPAINSDADAQASLSQLRKAYIEKKKVLATLSDLDRAFVLSLESIDGGLMDHEHGLATLLPQCPEIATQIGKAQKNVSSWREELRRLKAYVGVAQAKRHKLLDTAFARQERKIREQIKASLNKDLQDLDRLIRQVFAASDLQGEFEEWFYAESDRVIRDIYTYKQYHEPKAALITALQRAREYQVKAQALPNIGPGVNDRLISRTTLAVSEFTRMLDELKQQTWRDFLNQQTEVMRGAANLDKACQGYAREFFDLSLSAPNDEGRGAAKAFARFKRLCQGGV